MMQLETDKEYIPLVPLCRSLAMAKLWDKGYAVDKLVERFTVADDWKLDRHLAAADATASMAHAAMLAAIGILTPEEQKLLSARLREIIELSEAGTFEITREDEDCHTAIEYYLTASCGEAGKKIHTGRSRNDQVQTALRLWMRSFLLAAAEAAGELVRTVIAFAEDHAAVPMPGRTHMQIAMPSSVGLWAAAYAEELEDEIGLLLSAVDLINQCPLGSAASYGVPLPLDREMTSDLLGFARVQNNVLYANNSRGKFEAVAVDSLDYLCLTLSKAAQDLIIFSMPEFGYFSLPAELCTGSSIMPQKKNPDLLELVRSRSAGVTAASVQIKSIIRSLPSGYNRDFQDTKAPFLQAAASAYLAVEVMKTCFASLSVHPERLRAGFIAEIYATDRAIEAVMKGESFRDAYRGVGEAIENVEAGDPDEALFARTSSGTSGNLRLELVREQNRLHMQRVRDMKEHIDNAMTALVGRPVEFFRSTLS
jgi:argininosuccinate lyase